MQLMDMFLRAYLQLTRIFLKTNLLEVSQA
jgi:hypothetical protein